MRFHLESEVKEAREAIPKAKEGQLQRMLFSHWQIGNYLSMEIFVLIKSRKRTTIFQLKPQRESTICKELILSHTIIHKMSKTNNKKKITILLLLNKDNQNVSVRFKSPNYQNQFQSMQMKTFDVSKMIGQTKKIAHQKSEISQLVNSEKLKLNYQMMILKIMKTNHFTSVLMKIKNQLWAKIYFN